LALECEGSSEAWDGGKWVVLLSLIPEGSKVSGTSVGVKKIPPFVDSSKIGSDWLSKNNLYWNKEDA